MALTGKAAGKDVGMCLGPSAAAGALRMLVDAYPVCGLGVSVAIDRMYQTEVFAALHSPRGALPRGVVARAWVRSQASASSSGHSHGTAHGHGYAKPRRGRDRPVLLLLGIRLGLLDGMNSFYHETIEMLYTFPQSVGIAGGRPSSSYYFVGLCGPSWASRRRHRHTATAPRRTRAAGRSAPTLRVRGR
ncbi:hypothetical protein DFH09DRAFT_596776 [Mycena vulgaris]|nr:hypothetical protein DFH09DRAFT_596776 [Mycena vulgaris]